MLATAFSSDYADDDALIANVKAHGDEISAVRFGSYDHAEHVAYRLMMATGDDWFIHETAHTFDRFRVERSYA